MDQNAQVLGAVTLLPGDRDAAAIFPCFTLYASDDLTVIIIASKAMSLLEKKACSPRRKPVSRRMRRERVGDHLWVAAILMTILLRHESGGFPVLPDVA